MFIPVAIPCTPMDPSSPGLDLCLLQPDPVPVFLAGGTDGSTMRCPALKRALSSFEGRSAEHLEPLAAVCSLILSLRACWASAEGMGWLGDRTMKLWLCVPRVRRLDDIELAIKAMPVETNRFIAEIQLPPRDAFVRDVAGGSGAILRPRRPA